MRRCSSRRTWGVLVGVAIVGALVPAASAPATAATGWSISPSPSPPAPARGRLTSVTCQSSSSCFAVGFVLDDHGTQRALVGRSTGSPWSIVPAPVPAGAFDGSVALADVACASTNRCFAVGSYEGSDGTTMLIEQWNGAAWSVVDVAIPPGLQSTSLSGVSCRNSTTCFAVGAAFDGTEFSTLIVRWRGTDWSRLPSPNPAGGTSGNLVDVSCASAPACFAVGSFISNTTHGSQTLVERWNGTAWTVVASPNAPGTDRSALEERLLSDRDELLRGREIRDRRRERGLADAHRAMERDALVDRSEPERRRYRPQRSRGRLVRVGESLHRRRSQCCRCQPSGDLEAPCRAVERHRVDHLPRGQPRWHDVARVSRRSRAPNPGSALRSATTTVMGTT